MARGAIIATVAFVVVAIGGAFVYYLNKASPVVAIGTAGPWSVTLYRNEPKFDFAWCSMSGNSGTVPEYVRLYENKLFIDYISDPAFQSTWSRLPGRRGTVRVDVGKFSKDAPVKVNESGGDGNPYYYSLRVDFSKADGLALLDELRSADSMTLSGSAVANRSLSLPIKEKPSAAIDLLLKCYDRAHKWAGW